MDVQQGWSLIMECVVVTERTRSSVMGDEIDEEAWCH